MSGQVSEECCIEPGDGDESDNAMELVFSRMVHGAATGYDAGRRAPLNPPVSSKCPPGNVGLLECHQPAPLCAVARME